jgi:hypothetical protein
MFVTSTSEVTLPSFSDLLLMVADDCSDLRDFALRQPMNFDRLYFRREPELRLAVSRCYVDMDAGFFAREEVKPIRTREKLLASSRNVTATVI